MLRKCAYALGLMGVLLLPVATSAQSQQADRNQVVRILDDRYGESSAAIGLTDGGTVIEVFMTENGSTWTLVETDPSGKSRIVATGTAWIRLDLPIPGTDS